MSDNYGNHPSPDDVDLIATPHNERKRQYSFVTRILTKRTFLDGGNQPNLPLYCDKL